MHPHRCIDLSRVDYSQDEITAKDNLVFRGKNIPSSILLNNVMRSKQFFIRPLQKMTVNLNNLFL